MQHFLELYAKKEITRRGFVKEILQTAYKETGYLRDINSALLLLKKYFEKRQMRLWIM